jgi:hypothetical protein
MIYPNEMWPRDVEIQGLDGTTDVGTGLPYIAKGTGPGSVPPYEVQYNRREQRLNSVVGVWRQGMVVWEGGYSIGVYPVGFTLGGYRRVFEGASGVTLPDMAIKAVYLDSSAELQVAEVFPADLSTFLPLAIVQTGGGVVTITDKRSWTAFHVPSSGGGVSQTDRRILSAYRGTIAGDASLKIFEFDPRENLVLEEVQVFCGESVETVQVDVREAGVSVLAAPVSPVSEVVVKGVVADANLSAANNLGVYVTSDAMGFLTDLTVTLLLRTA